MSILILRVFLFVLFGFVLTRDLRDPWVELRVAVDLEKENESLLSLNLSHLAFPSVMNVGVELQWYKLVTLLPTEIIDSFDVKLQL